MNLGIPEQRKPQDMAGFSRGQYSFNSILIPPFKPQKGVPTPKTDVPISLLLVSLYHPRGFPGAQTTEGRHVTRVNPAHVHRPQITRNDLLEHLPEGGCGELSSAPQPPNRQAPNPPSGARLGEIGRIQPFGVPWWQCGYHFSVKTPKELHFHFHCFWASESTKGARQKGTLRKNMSI